MGVSKYSRGQVWFLTSMRDNGQVGSEQLKNRPYIIVSGNKNNFNSTILQVAPVTTRTPDRYPFHVCFKYENRDQVIEVEQVTTISVDRMEGSNYMYSLDEYMMDKVDKALMIQFGIYQKYTSMINEFNDNINNSLMSIISEYGEDKITSDELIKFIRKVNSESVDHIPKKNKWTSELIDKFLDDSKKMSLEDLANKYDLKNSSVAAQYKYKFMRGEK